MSPITSVCTADIVALSGRSGQVYVSTSEEFSTDVFTEFGHGRPVPTGNYSFNCELICNFIEYFDTEHFLWFCPLPGEFERLFDVAGI